MNEEPIDPFIEALLKSYPNIEEVRQWTVELYARYFFDWYYGRNVPMAKIDVSLQMEHPSWDERGNTIRIRLGENNLQSPDIRLVEQLPWPIWKLQLIHEMMHEWQSKIGPTPGTEAKKLAANPNLRFAGPGHDEVFYQAIVDHSAYFGMTPTDFAKNL